MSFFDRLRNRRGSTDSSMKFISYRSGLHPKGIIGLVDPSEEHVTPLRFPDNTPVRNMHQLIEEWDATHKHLLHGAPMERLDMVEVLAPLRGRDVICVGKNYKEHAEEFHKSGYDRSDNKAQPDYPVIFTKRSTSIIGHKHEIYPHPKLTQSLDYEGELAIIIGKPGIGISREDAWDHVWGATIINDVTARERQKDHKQFYIGKSFDTFCPMGPFAVHTSVLDWKSMTLETRLNGKLRQAARIDQMIFDIPTLIATCSMGTTLQPGDVIATGTPAGVCLSSGEFLKTGDRVDITISGLSTLSNTVGSGLEGPPPWSPLSERTSLGSSAYTKGMRLKGESGPVGS
ncbi:hypothetical protein L202_05275 [Cryptococcus amylolentus CBS 6039]|uniref:Fumarylacetoacetase-like C-terminal domain-containing protein n=2 Tax=Cryptococcus amylolentus TaxID=104669 RepID=A0A1E3HJV7_9TREE|nr:hypothetical protein L202_05275 [Cryptococcus amylolentus CBS 6039]ODN76628.1 hypothetical protein L202_05275 [Cryptococcus amylolentus CBS 6039]ODO04598.1 hypothetical protein I350_05204 [Cryptococcus amylolentus CBS 6273]